MSDDDNISIVGARNMMDDDQHVNYDDIREALERMAMQWIIEDNPEKLDLIEKNGTELAEILGEQFQDYVDDALKTDSPGDGIQTSENKKEK